MSRAMRRCVSGRAFGWILFAVAAVGAGSPAATGQDYGWGPLGSGTGGGTYTSVSALTIYNGELIAGGWFTTAGGVPCNNIARWDGSAWQPLGSGTNSSVAALTIYNGELIAGGGFTTAGGVACK